MLERENKPVMRIKTSKGTEGFDKFLHRIKREATLSREEKLPALIFVAVGTLVSNFATLLGSQKIAMMQQQI